MEIKYLVLDFGKVLAYPVSGHWFITPECWNILNRKEVDEQKLKEGMKKYNYILDEHVKTEQEELKMFTKFYKKTLEEIQYTGNIEIDSKKLAEDCVFNNNKYKLYDDVKNSLNILSKKYTLLLLSDNWPSGLRMINDYDINKYFKKVYISSICESKKEEKIFFDFPIKDYDIEEGQAIFVDDNIDLLKIAEEKGLIPIWMNRDNLIRECKYKTINCLKDLI